MATACPPRRPAGCTPVDPPPTTLHPAGNLCAQCTHGYGLSSMKTCGLCPGRGANTLFYVLSYGVTLILV